MFNTYDRTKNGFLTGPQARNILMQFGLPQNILAQIWYVFSYVWGRVCVCVCGGGGVCDGRKGVGMGGVKSYRMCGKC